MKKDKPPLRLAIALQTFQGDIHVATVLTRLICEIEKDQRDDIDFIISGRRGCEPGAIMRIADAAREKFKNVRVIAGMRYGTGWPSGCNDLWAETMMRVSLMRKRGEIAATGCFTFEPDCLPLRPDWLEVLKTEWAKAEADNYEVLGSIAGEPPDHINGNGIFACDILRKHMELNGSSATAGWDSYHGKLLLEIGKDTPFITQAYKKPGLTRDEFLAVRKSDYIPAILHGVKGTEGLSVLRAMIEDGTFFKR